MILAYEVAHDGSYTSTQPKIQPWGGLSLSLNFQPRPNGTFPCAICRQDLRASRLYANAIDCYSLKDSEVLIWHKYRGPMVLPRMRNELRLWTTD